MPDVLVAANFHFNTLLLNPITTNLQQSQANWTSSVVSGDKSTERVR